MAFTILVPPTKGSLADNPIRVIRKSQKDTLYTFSRKCGVSLQALYLNESGVYPTVLPSILYYLVSDLKCDEDDVLDAYFSFVRQKRKEWASLCAPYSLPERRVGHSPLEDLRLSWGLSRVALAKTLCIQPSLVHRVEVGKARKLPRDFVEALEEIEFPKELIKELGDRVENFYFSRKA